jgi:hypothetical protein
MAATRITINTDKFFAGITRSEDSYKQIVQANDAARKAVAVTLRALATEMEKGSYIGNFFLPMRDTSNWTAEQCIASFVGTKYENAEDNATLDLDGLRARARFTSPDGLGGDVDEL